MSTDKMREEFEAWVKSSCEFTDWSRAPDNSSRRGMYLKPRVELCWEAWQASRESLVIALPGNISLRTASEVRDMIRHHLEAAGVNVKVKP